MTPRFGVTGLTSIAMLKRERTKTTHFYPLIRYQYDAIWSMSKRTASGDCLFHKFDPRGDFAD